MTPDHWTQIKQIAGDAWALPDADREAYVRTTCAENEPLRVEVMNLLRAMTDAAGSFDRPIIDSVPLAAEVRGIAARRGAGRRQDRS